METLKWRCEEQEKLIPTQPESQREQLKQQLQQVTETLETSNHDTFPFKKLKLFSFRPPLFMFKLSPF